MALYEHVFLARQDISQQQVDQLVEHYKGMVESHGGKVGRIESWGLRPLTYRINKNRKAYYSLLNIEAPSQAIVEIERQMRISEDVLRYLTIRVDAHEEGASAMLARRERDNKEDRFGKDERPRRQRRPREDDKAAEGDA